MPDLQSSGVFRDSLAMDMSVGGWMLVFLVGLVGVSAACGGSGPASAQTPPSDLSSQAAPTRTVAPTPSTAVPTPSPPPSVSDETVLAEATFVHEGFRTQVTRRLGVEEVPSKSIGQTVVVSLLNLSRPSGSLGTRATINFEKGFDNYVDLPTEAGLLRLYLHRDGTLRPTADDGPFT